jgi:hypothetical protein
MVVNAFKSIVSGLSTPYSSDRTLSKLYYNQDNYTLHSHHCKNLKTSDILQRFSGTHSVEPLQWKQRLNKNLQPLHG